MLNGVLYVIGLIAGGGWRALVPRGSDVREALAMIRFYRRRRADGDPAPAVAASTRALQVQRAPACGVLLDADLRALIVLSGWAMHKPVQLGWLERMFVSYDGARVVHFACMLVLGSFVVPHVVLAIADGWDTLRSMVVGWSMRTRDVEHG
jgi:thiosulfate reductase cytochrome b subunit